MRSSTAEELKTAADRSGMYFPTPVLDQLVAELNRSNSDRAFGRLFTVLSGQPVVVPFKRKRQSNDDILPFCDRRTRARHGLVISLVERLEARGVVLAPFRAFGGVLYSGPTSGTTTRASWATAAVPTG